MHLVQGTAERTHETFDCVRIVSTTENVLQPSRVYVYICTHVQTPISRFLTCHLLSVLVYPGTLWVWEAE